MLSSGMWRRVALVKTDVSGERSASIVRVTRIGEVRTTLAVNNNRSTLRRNVLRPLIITNVVSSLPILVTLMMETLRSSERSVLTRATLHNFPKDGMLHSHRRENHISYICQMYFWCAKFKIYETNLSRRELSTYPCYLGDDHTNTNSSSTIPANSVATISH
jgi:hypothetical protein